MVGIGLAAINLFGKLGGKLIEDKDKKTEFAFKTLDIGQRFMETMLNTKTYPWVDALVKLAYAGEQIVKGLFRPVFSCGLFVWGLYNPESIVKLHEIGLLGDAAIGTIFGAAPAWGIDRGLDKRRKLKQKIKDDYEDDEW